MGSDTNLDFERLLTPISEEIPSGVELRGDSQSSGLFFQAKEARESARSIEAHVEDIKHPIASTNQPVRTRTIHSTIYECVL